jgi:SAM-dependent methyltransferase
MYRFDTECNHRNHARGDNIDTYWDDNKDLSDPGGWDFRYNHEADMIATIIANNPTKINTVLELGSGPGHLGNKILDIHPHLQYDRIDGESALRAYQRRNYKGRNFIVKDMFDSFDYDGLDERYDLVIANDFLEHIRNPALVVSSIRKLLTPNSIFFISIPNWRMKHEFYYPGLFDFDNFAKFLLQEYFDKIDIWESWSHHCPVEAPRQAHETTLPEQVIQGWNWYMTCKLSDQYIKDHNL